jgi:hypothetical protein
MFASIQTCAVCSVRLHLEYVLYKTLDRINK